MSPDGRRVVVDRTVQGNSDVWLLDGARTSRFTFDAAADEFPLWSPDGTRIVFRSNRTGPGDLYQKLASGAGVEERLVASDQTKIPTSWSADGRFLLYFNILGSNVNNDLWVVPMVGDRTPSVFLKTPSASPGRVLAGWPVGGLPVERIGADGNLRAALCPTRRGGRPRARNVVSGFRLRAALRRTAEALA